MSAPVAVLAVIDRESERAGGDSYSDGRDLIEVRAAVAELIEAGAELHKAGRRIQSAYRRGEVPGEAIRDEFGKAQRRFAEALSRVGGSK